MPVIIELDEGDGRRLDQYQFNIPPADHGAVIGKYNGHQIRKRRMGNFYIYTLYDPVERRADIKIEGRRDRKHFHLSRLNGRKGSDVKLYHLYVFLVAKQKLILYSDIRQTMPTVKTWEKLYNTPGFRLTHHGKDGKLIIDSDWLKNYGELTRFTVSLIRGKK